MVNYSDSQGLTSDRPSAVVSVGDPEDEQMNQEIMKDFSWIYWAVVET